MYTGSESTRVQNEKCDVFDCSTQQNSPPNVRDTHQLIAFLLSTTSLLSGFR